MALFCLAHTFLTYFSWMKVDFPSNKLVKENHVLQLAVLLYVDLIIPTDWLCLNFNTFNWENLKTIFISHGSSGLQSPNHLQSPTTNVFMIVTTINIVECIVSSIKYPQYILEPHQKEI